jgi:hypothetical protein
VNFEDFKGDQIFLWALLGGAVVLMLLSASHRQPVQSSYVPPYIPYGAITGSGCPPGWSSAWGGQPCGCPPATLC